MKKTHFQSLMRGLPLCFFLTLSLLGCHAYKQSEAELAIASHQFAYVALDGQHKIFLDSGEIFNAHSANPSNNFQSILADVAFVIKDAHPRYVTVRMPSVAPPKKTLQQPLMRERMNQVVAFLSASNTDARIIASGFTNGESGPGLAFFTAHGDPAGWLEIAYGE